MSTTTIRIEDDLKSRIADAAQRAGKSAHAFIVEAITQTVEQAEIDEQFHRVADVRWAALMADGQSVPLDQARDCVVARARGERFAKPKARGFGR